jgi:hypothetical protein
MEASRTVEIRRPLVGPAYRPDEFPVLERFRAEGGTDYLALAAWYGTETALGEIEGA